jgi:phospholipid transport system substrate-binding protein
MTGTEIFSAGSARFKAGFVAFAAMAVLVASQARAADAVDASQPAALIQTSSQALLKSLDANREVYRKDIKQLYKLVDDVFVPHFDVDFAAQQVLGKHWRTATPEQRKRFIAAFYRSLLQTYGDSLVEFTGDRMKVLPFQGDAAAPRATVRTEVRRSNGAAVAVNYSLRKMPAGDWKVWDVVIEGISYVKSFREDYGLEVDQKGLEPLIQRLEANANAKGGKA